MIMESLHKYAGTELICALDADGVPLSFAELEARSDALAAYMLQKLPSKAPVLLIGDKQNDMLCIIFACIKSAHTYVPLSCSVPEARARWIYEDAGAALTIALGTQLLADVVPRLDEDAVNAVCTEYQGQKPPAAAVLAPQDAMILLYTSGSTGYPKGVINRLGDIERLFESPECYYLGGEGMLVINPMAYMFSAHIQYIFRSMTCMGSTMVAVPAALQKNIAGLVDYYIGIQPQYIGTIATMCVQLLTDSDFCEARLPSLRGMAIAGEVVSRELLGRLFERFPQISVRIQYASTELTTVALGNLLTKADFEALTGEVVPLGKPMPSIEVELWDENSQQVSDGEKGELIIFNDRMCPGYWHLPELTAQSFFYDARGRRGFRTRDLMIRRNGEYYFAGRLDNRVKIGGNRVELEEIEAALTRLPQTGQAVVRPVEREGRVVALTAYITLSTAADNVRTILQIKRELAGTLPSYMIPSKIVILEAFPTNTSGKIDRAAMRLYHEKLSKGE